MQDITICDEVFGLDPTGAIFWRNQDMLLIADVHFGKVAHFRKYGAAVPSKASSTNSATFGSKSVLFDVAIINPHINYQKLLRDLNNFHAPLLSVSTERV